MKRLALIAAAAPLLLLSSCLHVEVGTAKDKPIHIVHDINIGVDKDLQNFFAFEESSRAASQPATSAATAPATAPTTSPATAPAPSPTTTTASRS